MKFSYYLYLIIAVAAGVQYYCGRMIHNARMQAAHAQSKNSEEYALAAARAASIGEEVKRGVRERKKYLNLKDPD